MMRLNKELVKKASKFHYDLFGREFELPLAEGVIDNKGRILSYVKIIGVSGFRNREVIFISFNKNTDELRVYAKQQKMILVIDVESWDVKKASFLEEFFHAENSNIAK